MSACKKVSKSTRAGVTWPVGRIHTMLKEKTPLRASPKGAAYLAGVMDFLTKELTKAAEEGMKNTGHKTARTREIQLGLSGEWAQMLQDGILAGGGVVPSQPAAPKKSKKSKKAADAAAPIAC